MSGNIEAIVMPKWGLAMEEGMLVSWQVEEGADLEKGQEIADIETTKITNIFESPVTGKLRKIVTSEGETVPVGFLLAVCADESVGDAEIEAYAEEFKANFVVEEAAAGGPELETVEIDDGRKIRYLAMGAGDQVPIVFIHGFGGDFESWMLNQEALSESQVTYALDLPGHGGSSKDVAAGGLESLADAVRAFMKAKSIEKAHLVGHSMGGGVALVLAKQDPDAAASLSLIAPAGFGPEINMEFIDGFIEQKRPRKLRGVLELLVHDAGSISAEMIDDVIKFKRLDGVDAALRKLRDQLMPDGRQSGGLKDILPGLSVPTQVLWGRNDNVLPVSQAEDLPDRIDLALFDDTGHLPHMERAAEINDRIARFIG